MALTESELKVLRRRTERYGWEATIEMLLDEIDRLKAELAWCISELKEYKGD